MSTIRTSAAAAAFAALLAVPVLARAQDQGPSPEEMKEKILEIERLMKSAEQSLARSTDTRSAADRAAEAAKKMLDEKARKETGKSAEELRKLAEGGSKEAAETLERLTKAANEESKKAAEKLSEVLGGGPGSGDPGSGGAGAGTTGSGEGIKKLIEKIKGDGQGASEGIRWILSKTKTSPSQSPSSGGSGQDKEKKPDAPDPKKPEEQKPDDKKPQSKIEAPRTPPFEQWYAELPEQVRKAYDSQDWDSIPPKWREMLRDWTKKMADELDNKERR